MQRIHIDGLGRTKDDLVIQTVKELFQAQDLEHVIFKSQQIRTRLESLGCFKSVGVFIDTGRGPNATSDSYDVTFVVKEMKRVLGGINTQVGNNEGSVVVSAKLPNTFGRGEKMLAEYTYGTKQSRGFNGTFVKPLHNKASTL